MFSPSIKLDPQYEPLRKYLEKMSDQDKEPLMFEDLDQQVLGKLLDDQRQIVEERRKRKQPSPNVCLILDDLADRGDILQKRQGAASGGSWMVTLATRGRHFGVSWIVSSQVLNLVGTVVRKNVRCMCVWRLRNRQEVETLCDELSGCTTKIRLWSSIEKPPLNHTASCSCAWTQRLVRRCSTFGSKVGWSPKMLGKSK